MGRTFLQQDTQIYASYTYDDTLVAGSTLQSGAATAQDDLNSLRSQIKRIIWTDAAGNWYDDIQTVNGKKRALKDLNVDLDDIETKRFLFRTEVLTDITIPATQNYVVLSVAGSEAPSQVAAVGAATTEGAVVAFHSGTFGTHSLNLVTGPNGLTPKNLVIVRDATTKQVISSSGKDVYGLIQSEIVTNGHTFDDTTQRVQISFVIENAGGTALIACPAVDIQGKSINYAYVRRMFLDNIPEDAYLMGVFTDQSATTDVTLDNAVDNQSGPVTQTQNIDWRISDTFALKFEDSTGARNIFQVAPASGNDTVSVDADTITFTNPTNNTTFTNGVSFDTSGTQLNVGVTAGQIDSAAALTLLSGGTSDLAVRAAGELYLDDSNQTGSTWAQTAGIKLSDTTAEWDNFEAAFGEVSLLNAIYQARSGSRIKGVAVPTGNISANTNVTFVGGGANIDAQLPAYLGADFVSKVDVYLNGDLLRNGANSGANHDVYPGTTPANGDLMFEFNIKGGGSKPDVITVIVTS